MLTGQKRKKRRKKRKKSKQIGLLSCCATKSKFVFIFEVVPLQTILTNVTIEQKMELITEATTTPWTINSRILSSPWTRDYNWRRSGHGRTSSEMHKRREEILEPTSTTSNTTGPVQSSSWGLRGSALPACPESWTPRQKTSSGRMN